MMEVETIFDSDREEYEFMQQKKTPMNEAKLKPCPFCGGKAVIETYKSRKGYEANIQCNGNCILYMSTITYDTEEEAAEAVTTAWNRRATDERAD